MNCNCLQVTSICTVYDSIVYHLTFGAGVTVHLGLQIVVSVEIHKSIRRLLPMDNG